MEDRGARRGPRATRATTVLVPAVVLLVSLGVHAGGANPGVSSQAAGVDDLRSRIATSRVNRKPPGAPGGLRVVSESMGRPTIAWSTGSKASSIRYFVYRNHRHAATTRRSRFRFAVVPCGAAQNLGVRTVDGRGRRSPESSVLFRRTCPVGAPGACYPRFQQPGSRSRSRSGPGRGSRGDAERRPGSSDHSVSRFRRCTRASDSQRCASSSAFSSCRRSRIRPERFFRPRTRREPQPSFVFRF